METRPRSAQNVPTAPSTEKIPLREARQGGRGKLRGEEVGAKATHTITLSKVGPGPLTPALYSLGFFQKS